MFERITQHFLHGFVAHIHGAAHLNALLRARFRIAREHVEDAVCIDLKLHTDASVALWRRLEGEIKFTKLPIIPREFALSLQNANEHRALPRDCIGEKFAALDGNGGVSRDNDIHQPAKCLDAEREWRHVEEHHVLHRTAQDAGLDGRTDSHRFVRILIRIRFTSENLGNQPAHHRHSRLPAHKNHFVQLRRLHACVCQRLQAMRACALDDWARKPLQFRACECA
jgi:hypothetical protein